MNFSPCDYIRAGVTIGMISNSQSYSKFVRVFPNNLSEVTGSGLFTGTCEVVSRITYLRVPGSCDENGESRCCCICYREGVILTLCWLTGWEGNTENIIPMTVMINARGLIYVGIARHENLYRGYEGYSTFQCWRKFSPFTKWRRKPQNSIWTLQRHGLQHTRQLTIYWQHVQPLAAHPP